MKVKLPYENLLKWFPNYDYHKVRDGVDKLLLDFRTPNNIVGHMQRAFIVYWCLKGAEKGGIGIDVGCGQAISPFCIGVDKYSGPDHPDYGGGYHPHLMARCDRPLPFEDDCFDFLVSMHSLEHMEDTLWTLEEWIRMVKPRGVLAIVMPDAKYTPKMGEEGADKSHKVDWTAEDFKEQVLDKLSDKVEVVEFDTFLNNFSFNVVLKKRG